MMILVFGVIRHDSDVQLLANAVGSVGGSEHFFVLLPGTGTLLDLLASTVGV